jgi:glutathione reductase (NADPH)
MAAENYDLVVIGAGSGGVRAARLSAALGKRVAVIESSRVGGTCVMRGCVPKKLLVHAAHMHEEIEDAGGFGWRIGQVQHDWPAMMANKDAELDRLEGIYNGLLSNAGAELIRGEGRLLGEQMVAVGERILTAEKILIAVGGRAVKPDVAGAELAITSDEALSLVERPGRILVVGGGYIAVEFAGIFHGLGSEVCLAYRRDLMLRGFDTDLRRHLQDALGERGMDVRLHCEVQSLQRQGEQIDVTFNDDSKATFDEVLFATGRSPNTHGLGGERAGLELAANGAVKVDEYSRTNVAGVFAVGDVTDKVNLTPVALQEATAWVRTQFQSQPTPVDHAAVPSAVFSQPPLACVGLSEDEAVEAEIDIKVFESRFRPLKATMSGRAERSYMKLIVERATDRVLGVHMLGPDAAEILQGFAVAVKAGLKKSDFDATLGIHPSSAEEFVTMRTERGSK